MMKFDRILGFDELTSTISVEGGVTLWKLMQFLIPRGFWLAVQPGYPGLSVGGCIAGNVHGKNHYTDGSFSNVVRSLQLYHPDHGELNVSRDKNSELFGITCGGLGLTGVILSANLAVEPLPGNFAVVDHIKVGSLQETVEQLNRMKDKRDILYTWNDLSRFDGKMGRGYVVSGSMQSDGGTIQLGTHFPKIDPNVRRFRPPVIQAATLPLINAGYYYLSRSADAKKVPLIDLLFPWLKRTKYFDLYGDKGIIEPQFLVPWESLPSWLPVFEKVLRLHCEPFAIASLKIFRGKRRLIRYDGNGVSFSLQIPNSKPVLRLLDEVDELNVAHGVYTNVLKDSRLSAEVAQAEYPELPMFVAALDRFDPNRRFRNSISTRLKL
jgi:FAD/FMN-containing dehydrogenase